MKHFILSGAAALLLSAGMCHAADLPLKVPQGITVEKLAALDHPRFLAFTSENDLLAGSGAGKIYRLRPPYTSSEVLVDFGGYPHSVWIRHAGNTQELLVGDSDAIYKVNYDTHKTYQKSDFTKIVDVPGGGGHSSRTVKSGPDGKIYVSLGIASNCSPQYLDNSYPESERRGGIFWIDESKNPPEKVVFANGLRNPVGFAWQPDTGVMYADNNGPDHWGFDEPREEFVEVQQGRFFGMPWYQFVGGKVTVDTCAPQDKAPRPITDVTPPVATFDARQAPMDVKFIHAGQFNPAWAGSALVALHGSWAVPDDGDVAKRRVPRIVLVEFKDGKPTGKVSDVVTGFQDAQGNRYARPVGMAWGPDGLYFSSDENNAGIYRLKYTK